MRDAQLGCAAGSAGGAGARVVSSPSKAVVPASRSAQERRPPPPPSSTTAVVPICARSPSTAKPSRSQAAGSSPTRSSAIVGTDGSLRGQAGGGLGERLAQLLRNRRPGESLRDV